MRYKVSLLDKIDFAPKTEVAEILQNIRTILSTRKGTVPLARELGITWEHLGKPLPVAKALQQEAIIEAIEDFEPRARVISVVFENDTTDMMEGILSPCVVVAIGEDETEEEW
ncbi:MAG: GPW/gp25 family protein [Lentisphaeria bacterium]|nr:GPW/gp25 family protein [Lentisphaeria bacterium]